MYCPSCGSNLPDNVRFCDKCGASINTESQNVGSNRNYQSSYNQTPQVMTQNTGSNYPRNNIPVPMTPIAPPAKKQTVSKGTLIAIISSVVALLVVVGLLLLIYFDFGKSDKKSGGKEADATGTGSNIIEITDEDPDKQTAENIDCAKQNIVEGKYLAALNILENLTVDKESKLYEDYSTALKVAQLANVQPKADVSVYPAITLTAPYKDGIMPEIDTGRGFSGMDFVDKKIESGMITLVLIDKNVPEKEENRELEIPVKVCGYEITLVAEYKAPAKAAQTPSTVTVQPQPVQPQPQIQHVSRYEVYREPLTWTQARIRCEQLGGHLVTINSQAEENEIIRLITEKGVKYTWLGGYTTFSGGIVTAYWITGEPFSYAPWGKGEPSGVDKDGTVESALILWNIERKGGWTWNDERDNPFVVNPGMMDDIGFVCEYED